MAPAHRKCWMLASDWAENMKITKTGDTSFLWTVMIWKGCSCSSQCTVESKFWQALCKSHFCFCQDRKRVLTVKGLWTACVEEILCLWNTISHSELVSMVAHQRTFVVYTRETLSLWRQGQSEVWRMSLTCDGVMSLLLSLNSQGKVFPPTFIWNVADCHLINMKVENGASFAISYSVGTGWLCGCQRWLQEQHQGAFTRWTTRRCCHLSTGTSYEVMHGTLWASFDQGHVSKAGINCH